MTFWERDDRKIQFIQIPKTGTTSIRNLLESNGWIERKSLRVNNSKHNYYDEYKKSLEEFSPEVSFTIVRNPFDRAMSQIYQMERAYRKRLDCNAYVQMIFDRFIRRGNFHIEDNHWIPQFKFINEKTQVFKNESLDSLVSFLKENNIIDNDSTLNHLNSKKQGQRQVFNSTTLDFLKSYYRRDFETMNYDFVYLGEEI